MEEKISRLFADKRYGEICGLVDTLSVDELSGDTLYKCAVSLKNQGFREKSLDFYDAAFCRSSSDEYIKAAAETAYAIKDFERLEKYVSHMEGRDALNFDYYFYSFHCAVYKKEPAEKRIEYAEKVLEISYDAECMYTLALLYRETGNIPKCRRTCRRLIRFFTDGEWNIKAREMLDRIEKEKEPECHKPSESKHVQTAKTEMPAKENTNKLKKYENTGKPPADKKETKDDILPEELKKYFKDIIGMRTVKEQIVKIYNTVKIQLIRSQMFEKQGKELPQNQKSYNFILLGNPGTGKTTVARIIGTILFDLKVRKNDCFIEADRSKLVGQYIGQTENIVRNTINSARGGVLFIDEAYALYKSDSQNDFGREAIDCLLKDMEDNRGDYSVILAGYKKPMEEMLKNSNSGFRSRFTYIIDIPDYTDEELIQIAYSEVSKQCYILGKGAENAIKKAIAREKIDETFGNARFIRELINRAQENQSERLSKTGIFSQESINILEASDIFPDCEDKENAEKYIAQLNALIGLNSVKKEVKTIIDSIIVQKEMDRIGIESENRFGTMHMCFLGNAGTGKTTVARLIGKIYTALGILKRGDVFVECSRSSLVGKWQGHTAAKVRETVNRALGGILFVDEAYSLDKGEGDSFGKEAIDTLVAEIENHRDSFIVIFAGYRKEMDEFFKSNQGLRSRISTDIVFDDYTVNELFEVFEFMIKQMGYSVSENAMEKVKEIILSKSKEENFGNARGIRNITDTIIKNQSSRIAGIVKENKSYDPEIFKTILEDDVILIPERLADKYGG